jgi:hypothetical protein
MILKASDGRSGDVEVLESLLRREVTADQLRAIETELYTIRRGVKGEHERAAEIREALAVQPAGEPS